MDKEKNEKKRSFFENIVSGLRSEAQRRKSERGALTVDIAVFLCAFFFARRHIVFGAYPLAVSLVAVLPTRVWVALIGSVSGALSMGKVGVIHAIISLIVAFLRIIISGGAQKNGEQLFSEPLIMRLSAATIGAFVGAGYEMLLSGFSFSSVLFGVFGVGLTLGFSFIFSGLFFADVRAVDLLYGEKSVFSKREGRERVGIVFFQISLSVICLLITLSLEAYSYFGISLAYLFAASLTLFVSKRFGAVRGAAIGFISVVGVSPIYAPAFALIGVASGFLFGFGIGYGIVGAGIVYSLWGGYVGGMSGFLSLFPEYLIASVLSFTALKRARAERGGPLESETVAKRAEEMVGASWLSESRTSNCLSLLEESLLRASGKIRDFSLSDGTADFEEYKRICTSVFEDEKITASRDLVNIISTKLYKKQKFSPSDTEFLAEQGVENATLSKIASECAAYEKSLYEKRRIAALAEEYELISKMINESRISEREAAAINEPLSSLASEVFTRYGFPEGYIKVFGDEKIRILGAGLDSDGSLITSQDFKTALEEAVGVKLGGYEYFRKGEMALFKCSSTAAFKAEYATASAAASEKEISGDSAAFFCNGCSFFSVISDGMGSGREAKESSAFVTGYLSDLLTSEVGISTAVSALSHVIRHKAGECTATLDLFRLDLVRGDALFVKCGAAPSFVKRERSIFRIRSETAPIGLMKSVDAEKIRVEIKSGDVIIMLSDGVSTSVEDSTWLLSYLSDNAPSDNLNEYAEQILSLAKRNGGCRDDMTVSVIKILSRNG